MAQSKARRAAKSRQRARDRARRAPASSARPHRPTGDPGPGSSGPRQPPPDPAEEVVRLLGELVDAAAGPDAVRLADRLAEHSELLVTRTVEYALVHAVGRTSRHGWQPRELRRQVRARLDAASSRLSDLVLRVLVDRVVDRPVDPRWREQLDEAPAVATVSSLPGWLERWRAREGLHRAATYRLAAALLAELEQLPVLDVLIPAPGQPAAASRHGLAPSVAQLPVLERVRKLLAKAESTEFEDEALALTAKAQQLMTRHAIDEAALAGVPGTDGPRMTRVPVDAPYADAKAALLGVVADATRCRAVYLTGLGLCTVVGHGDDLASVELVFTSLQVQMQRFLAQRGRQMGAAARRPSFRASFIVGFADRIRERLADATQEVIAEAGGDALPVLRSRAAAAADLFESRFAGSLRSGRIRSAWDGRGHLEGRMAADRAQLGAGMVTAPGEGRAQR